MNAIKVFFKAIANIFCGILTLIMVGVFVYGSWQGIELAVRLAKIKCLVLPPVLYNFALAMFCLFLGMLFLRFMLGAKSPDKFRYSSIFLGMVISMCGAIAFNVLDENLKDSFKTKTYVPYIQEYQTRTISGSTDVDYSKYDKLVLRGWITSLAPSFRRNGPIEIIEDETLTDKIAVVVYYKGIDVKLDFYFDSDDELNLSVWAKDWDDNEITVSDKAYMYKYGYNIEYADKYAVEKIVIRTAYPEKLDINDLYARGEW